MIKRIISIIPGVVFFAYYVSLHSDPKPSGILGTLAISIAIGAVVYFYFNAPQGKRKTETAFGITGEYRQPVYGTIIPMKTAIYVLGAVISSCLLGFLLYIYGY